MNYRHAFHAGGPADVVKHAVLARILVHLREKPAAFRVIDTHAGAGLYDLRGPEASRSPEWRDGIARLLTGPIDDKARTLLAPYLDVVADLNAPGELAIYPGSPALIRALLRPQDRLVACELEPERRCCTGAQSRPRPARTDRGDRRLGGAQRLCTATRAPRPRADRSTVRAGRRIHSAHAGARSGAPQMGQAASICFGTRSRHRQQPDALARRLRRSAISKILRAEVDVRSAKRARAALRLRSDHGESALDAGRRACCDAAGAGAHFCRLLSRRLAKSAGPMTGRIIQKHLATYFSTTGLWLIPIGVG